MVAPSCVFHHPAPIGVHRRSGSGVRPVQMVEAFEALGFEVELVTGFVRERNRRMNDVLASARDGKRYDFVYSESHTLPTALTEPHHLPLHRVRDFEFFARMRRRGTPVGLFYRDAYWRFPYFDAEFPWWKRWPARWQYRADLRAYRRTVDRLFLPSLRMATALPGVWEPDRLEALPPGGTCAPEVRSDRDSCASGRLRLLYVGGVSPPFYDLTPLFEGLATVPQEAHLTVCCRAEEWLAQAGRYAVPENVDVVHLSGADLADLYRTSDAVAIVRRRDPYLDFAMPVKVPEAIGHGRPIITNAGTETARFVAEEGVGWVVDGPTEFTELARRLAATPQLVDTARDLVVAACPRHTWFARARQVRDTLVRRPAAVS